LCETSNYTSSLCNQIIRPLGPTDRSPANTPSAILTVVENLASQLTSGVDFEAAYPFDLVGGRASIRALGTRLIDFDQTNAVGQPVRHLAGNADFAQLPLPKWRGLVDLSYRLGHFTAGMQERYIGAFNRSDVQVYQQNRIAAVFFTDLNASYQVPSANGEIEIFGVVNNAFNKKPPLAPVAFTPGLSPPHYVNVHDILGRYVTVGARVRF
jgi:hypothetical protein